MIVNGENNHTPQAKKERKEEMTDSEVRTKIDNLAAIKKAIETLDGFHELIHLRMEYAHEQKMGEFSEPLKNWVVLGGTFMLLSDGRVASACIGNTQLKEPIPGILPVMRLPTFRNRQPNIRFVLIRPNTIPMDGCKCHICRQGWVPCNCMQSVAKVSGEYIVFNRFAGKKLVNVLEECERETRKMFFTNWIVDENNRRVDFQLNSVVRPGMKGHFDAVGFVHPECVGKNFWATR